MDRLGEARSHAKIQKTYLRYNSMPGGVNTGGESPQRSKIEGESRLLKRFLTEDNRHEIDQAEN